MSDTRLGTVIRRLHQFATRVPADGFADACLLERYVASRDAEAFALIVHRHGPLVWRVCQRVVGNYSDAEDCFQATFLILARRAGRIRKSAALASWLHGVAYRVARTAQRRARRAPSHAPRELAAPGAEPAQDAAWRELARMVEEEVHRLPDTLRQAVLACYWQGLTNEEAAQQLGWPSGTVKTRLAKARAVLHQRLLRRGVTLPVGTLVLLLAPSGAQATLPASVACVSLFTTRTVTACTGGSASGNAALLANAAMSTALSGKAKLAGVLLLLALALGGASAVTQSPQAPIPRDELPTPVADEPKPEQPATRQDADGIGLPRGAIARLGSLRFNHGSPVHGFHITPDARTIVSLGSGSLCLWDAATGQQRARMATDRLDFGAASRLLPDGKTLLILRQQTDTLQTWDLEQRKQIRELALPVKHRIWYGYQHPALAPDGRRCMTHADSHVQVWDTSTGKELLRVPADGQAIRAATFAGNDRLVIADKKKMITLWDIPSGKPVRQFPHGGPAEVLATSRDGRWLATLEHHTRARDSLLDRDVVHVWDLTTGTRKHRLAASPKSWFMSVQFAPDGSRVLAYRSGNHENGLMVWDTRSGALVREMPAGVFGALTPDGRYLVAGGTQFSVWDMHTGKECRVEGMQRVDVDKLHLSAPGDRVLTLGWSSFATWDVATGVPLRTVEVPPHLWEPPFRCCSPDGRYVVTFRAVAKLKVEVLLWDVAAGKLLHRLNAPDDRPLWYFLQFVFSPDSSLLAMQETGKETVIRLWDVRTGRQVRVLKLGSTFSHRPAFSGDGRTLFVVGARVVAYDVATGAERFSWRLPPPPNSVHVAPIGGRLPDDDDLPSWRTLAFSPDGTVAAGVLIADVGVSTVPKGARLRVKDRLALCDARSGKILRRWNDSGENGSDSEQVIFSDDGRLLATSDMGVVHVWETATASKVATFAGHRDEIRSLAFSSGGWRLASSSRDSTVLVWDLALAVAGRPSAAAAWWDELADPDAAKAYGTIAQLAARPAVLVPLLDKRLKAVTPAEVQRQRRWIADLDSTDFAIRDAAFEQLAAQGPAVVPLLRQLSEQQSSLETRRRIERLLDRPESRPSAGEPLRLLRALTALERAGTPEAHRLLARLADGAAEAWLTQEAQAAMSRRCRQVSR